MAISSTLLKATLPGCSLRCCYAVTVVSLLCHYFVTMQVAAMQVDNVYRPTEDTTGRHRQLLTALADAALQRAKRAMQQTSTTGQFHLPVLHFLALTLLPNCKATAVSADTQKQQPLVFLHFCETRDADAVALHCAHYSLKL